MTRISASSPSTGLSDRIAGLRTRLDELRDLVEAEPAGDGPASAAPVESLLELVRTYDDRDAYDALERDGAISGYRAVFGPRVLAVTAAAERRVGAELRAAAREGGAAIESTLGSNAWGAYAGMAATLASVDLSRCRSFAMVGCGPLPDSLLCLHERTAIDDLVGIDRDRVALAAARDLTRMLGLERVRFAEGDGLDLDYGRFDAICPSVFAVPRRAVLERIAQTARDDALIILRDPFFTGTLMFEPLIEALPGRLEVRARTASQPGKFMLRRYLVGVRAGQRSRSA